MPYVYIIDPANVCNLRCPLCPTGNGTADRPKKLMSLACYTGIIDQIRPYAIEVILHNWGESLLHPKIVDMIRYTSAANIGTSVSSHLNQVSDELIDGTAQDRIEHRHPPQRGGLDRVGAHAHDVQRRVRLLQRLGNDPDLRDREVTALERKPFGGPRPDQDREGLVEALPALDLGDAVALELDRAVAAADADVETAAAEDVDHRQLFGQPDRIVEGQDGGGQADPHALRAHGGGRGQERGRDRQPVLDEVMLGQPDAVEAQLFRPHDLLELAVDDVGMGHRGRSLQEVVGAEAHGRWSLYLSGRRPTTSGGLGRAPRLRYAVHVLVLNTFNG